MPNDRVRLQIRTNIDPEVWSDVGDGANGVSVPVSVESSALPSGAATYAAQTDGSQKTQIVDSSGNSIDSIANGSMHNLLVDTNDIHTTGSLGSLNATVTMYVHGTGSAILLVGGTWTGKIVFEGSIDNTWVNLSIVQPNGGITFNGIQNDNQNGSYRALIIAGYSQIRARMSSYTNGTATIEMNASDVVGTSYVWQLVPSNLNANVYLQTLSTIYNGSKTVPTITAGAIATTQAIKSVTVKALSTNTVAVYVGASGVTTSTGIELLADESVTIDIDDLAKVFVISGSAAQTVRYIAV